MKELNLLNNLKTRKKKNYLKLYYHKKRNTSMTSSKPKQATARTSRTKCLPSRTVETEVSKAEVQTQNRNQLFPVKTAKKEVRVAMCGLSGKRNCQRKQGIMLGL